MTRSVRHLASLVVLSACSAGATCPQFDRMQYEGQLLTIYRNTVVPSAPALDDWLRNLPACSASNQGRALYEVSRGTMFLTGFISCSGFTPKPSAFYPAVGDRMEASWLTGELEAFGGRAKGIDGMCHVYETRWTFTLEAGRVVSVRRESNPAVPLRSFE
jgi:hypothetical protein